MYIYISYLQKKSVTWQLVASFSGAKTTAKWQETTKSCQNQLKNERKFRVNDFDADVIDFFPGSMMYVHILNVFIQAQVNYICICSVFRFFKDS